MSSYHMQRIIGSRQWDMKVSLVPRLCYITGKNIRFSLCYRGRKRLSQNSRYDDIWLCKSEYLNQLKLNNL